MPANIDDWEARLAADDELVRLLEWEGFEGPESEKLYTALMEYGHAVLGAWLKTGVALSRCREKRVRVPEGDLPRVLMADDAEREDLVANTVARAVVGFRETVLKTHKWSAARGATLKTFFVGQVLLRFGNEYRDWLTDRRKRPSSVPIDLVDGGVAQNPGPEAALIGREELHRQILGIPTRRLRQAAVLHALGYQHQEIAELLGLPSSKAVEMHLYRLRKDRHDAA